MNPDSQRRTRFIASATLLTLGGIAIGSIGLQLGIRRFSTIGLYAAYLLVSACLMAVLAGRLFEQHEMRKLRFDIASVIILTTLIALPLGIGSAFQQLAVDAGNQFSQEDLNGPIQFMIAFLLYFLLLPNLFATEAVLAWCSSWQRRKKQT